MRATGEVRLILEGPGAGQYVGRARTELGILHTLMKFNELQQLTRTIPLADGGEIHVSSVFGQDTIWVSTTSSNEKEAEEKKGRITVAGEHTGTSPRSGFRWEEKGSESILPTPLGNMQDVQVGAMSKDGKVVVGTLGNAAVRWSAAGKASSSLGANGSDSYASASDVSDDGNAIAGTLGYFSSPNTYGFRWNSVAGSSRLASLVTIDNPHEYYRNVRSLSISGDGQRIYGTHGPHEVGEVYDTASLIAEFAAVTGIPIPGLKFVQFGYDAFVVIATPVLLYDLDSITVIASISPPADLFDTRPVGPPYSWNIPTGLIDPHTGSEFFAFWYATKVVEGGAALTHSGSGAAGTYFPSTPVPIADFVCWWDASGAIHKTSVRTLAQQIYVSKDSSTLVYRTPEYGGGVWKIRRAGGESGFGDDTFTPSAIDGTGAAVPGFTDLGGLTLWSSGLGLIPLAGPIGAEDGSTSVNAISQDGTVMVGTYYASVDDSDVQLPCMWVKKGYTIDPHTHAPVATSAAPMAASWGADAVPKAVTVASKTRKVQA